MADQATVTVSLSKARVFRGRAYGPGSKVEVPARVAKAFGLDSESAGTKEPTGKKPKK